jgi:hypothetical protein
VNTKETSALAASFSGSSDGVFHVYPIGRAARVISWEAARAFVAGRGGCPCEPGTAAAWIQYTDHLREVAATGDAPDHSMEAEYGPKGRKMSETVDAWSTVHYMLASNGLEASKPSPRKAMIATAAGTFTHAEITWLAKISPGGYRLFSLTFYRH